MLDLRNLIIQRFNQTKNLQKELMTCTLITNSPFCLQQELQMNRNILKLCASWKKNERQRIIMEKQLLKEMKELSFWQNGVLENFYTSSLAIFASHNTYYLQFLENGTGIAQRLELLYEAFKQKEGRNMFDRQSRFREKGQIIASQPYEIFTEVSKWSQRLFSQELQRLMGLEFERHEQQMSRLSFARDKKLKQNNALSISANGQGTQNSVTANLKNKESVLGLFLDELQQFYKFLPLQLDYSDLKSIRKVHNKTSIQWREDQLAKAVEILIQAKNKVSKQQIEEYKQQYCARHPQTSKDTTKALIDEGQQQNRPLKKLSNRYKESNVNRAVDKVHSQIYEKEPLTREKSMSNRNSLLLRPRAAEIAFEKPIKHLPIKQQQEKQQVQLPEIARSKFIVGHSKSTCTRSKPISSFMNPITRSMLGPDKANKVRVANFPTNWEFHPQLHPYNKKSVKKEMQGWSNEGSLDLGDNPEKKKQGPDFSKNRKLMLQLLRDKKNRLLFVDE